MIYYVTGHTFFQLKVEFTVHIFILGRYLVSKIFEIEIWVLQVTFKYSTYANSLLVSSDKKDKE